MPLPQNLYEEMQKLTHSDTNLKSYKYQRLAAILEGYVGHTLTAGLIGAIIPESGTDHTVINKWEYRGDKGYNKNAIGWNCGEGLVGFTFWESKLQYIKMYNAHPKCTQPLPTTWAQYNVGKPIDKGYFWHAPQDGRHIAGITLENHVIFLYLYYETLLNELKNEKDFPTIVAKIYQQKAGIGLCKEYINDPIVRAYQTAKKHYNRNNKGNHYLISLKIGQQYLNGGKIDPASLGPVSADTTSVVDWSATSIPMGGTPVDKGTISQKDLLGQKDGELKMPGRILGSHIKQS